MLPTLARDLPLIFDDNLGTADPSRNTFAGLTVRDRAAREEILHRAYLIWESQGHPEGRQLANWLKAEADVLPRSQV